MVSRLNEPVRNTDAPVTKDELVGEFRCRAIREAAMRVVGRRGLAAATVQEIADEANVAKGTVYLYFKSREEIFDKTLQDAVDDLLDRLRAAVDAGGTFPESLERFLTTQLSFFDERKDFFRLYFATGEGSEEQRLKRIANRERHVTQIADLVRNAATAGEIQVDDADGVALAIAGAAREVILKRVNDKPPRPLAEDVALLVQFFCHGVRCRRKKR